MKNAFGAATVALILAATTASADPVWDRIQDSGTLTCGAIPNDRIGSWVDRDSGEWVGYEVALCRAIAEGLSKEMGKEIKPAFKETSWKTVVLDIQSSKIDIWPGMSATEERKKALSMIGPMYDLAFCGLLAKGFEGGETWESLNKPEVRIATVTGSSVEAAFKKSAPNATHISLAEYSEATLAVQSRRADVMGADILRCATVQATAANSFGNVVIPEPVTSMGSSAGLLKDATDLSAWLTTWAEETRASGGVTQIFKAAFEAADVDPSQLPSNVNF